MLPEDGLISAETCSFEWAFSNKMLCLTDTGVSQHN
jgi:hypothetical protein